jgi:GNAT superfamily N-acetyltransferase
MIVRLATAADATDVARLNEKFNGVHTAPEVMAQRMAVAAGVEHIYLAEVDGAVAGFATLWIFPVACFPEPYAEVSELYVDEIFRRCGVGTALMEAAIQAVRSAGAIELKLNTGFRNSAAQQFYARLGFVNLALHLYLPLPRQQES